MLSIIFPAERRCGADLVEYGVPEMAALMENNYHVKGVGKKDI